MPLYYFVSTDKSDIRYDVISIDVAVPREDAEHLMQTAKTLGFMEITEEEYNHFKTHNCLSHAQHDWEV